MSLQGKTLFITGASRGIGLAIALRAARDGANIAIAAKTETPHPKLPGTIHTAAADITAAGGQALPLAVDVRDDDAVAAAIDAHCGGLRRHRHCRQQCQRHQPDAHGRDRHAPLRPDASDQHPRDTSWSASSPSRISRKAANPHVLMLSPPLDLQEKWFAPHTAYSIAKYGMSLVVLGLAGELRGKGIAVNALWPRTTIATAAIKNLLGGEALMRRSRKPEIRRRCGLCGLSQAGAPVHRSVSDRRHVPRRRRRHAISTATGSTRARRWRLISSFPKDRYRPSVSLKPVG